jgi:hypothetical protein
MRFAIFVIDSEIRTGSSTEMVAIDAFNDKLREGQNWIMAFGMEGPDSDSIQSLSLFYSGMWIIEAESLAEANQLADEASRACNRRVEVRAFL